MTLGDRWGAARGWTARSSKCEGDAPLAASLDSGEHPLRKPKHVMAGKFSWVCIPSAP